MIFKIFCVHDSKAEAFMTPFFMPTRAMAQRVFEQMVRDPDHQFSKAKEDYTLFEIGTYDDQDAAISENTPKSVLNGITVTPQEE